MECWRHVFRDAKQDATLAESYTHESFSYFANLIKHHQPDIITLQETHARAGLVQAKSLAEELGYSYFLNDIYDQSHLKNGQGLGQAIIARYPLKKHQFELFLNPHYQLQTSEGEVWVSHNKGVSRAVIQIKNTALEIMTLHMIPFRKFGVDPLSEEAAPLRADIQKKLAPTHAKLLLQGDFNFNEPSLKAFLPTLFDQGIQEVIQDDATTPKGRRYDHIVFRGLAVKESTVLTDVLTDHFPILSIFEV